MNRSPYFLFVGRLEKIKGVQDVLPHFGPDAPAELWIVGAGGYEGELRRQAAGSKNVRFLGLRTPAQLRELYRGAVAVIVPSVCYEVFGIVLLEAFRERTPVIARARGPLIEIVQRSGGGILIETRDQLGEAIERLRGDDGLRRELGGAGHRALKAYWTEDVVIEQYLDVVRRVATRKGCARIVDRLSEASGKPEAPVEFGGPRSMNAAAR